ncbi:MAG: transposase [Nostoc sp.]|uniref:transposase n=1 Tax=Nostoc sp. TaxID=1180 RepID=UPI002FF8A1F0
MKHQVRAAMPKFFENWCRRFDDLFSRQVQRQSFRMYLGGLLGESDRKNLAQIANNTVDGFYNSLRHFLNNAAWDVSSLNNRRL